MPSAIGLRTRVAISPRPEPTLLIKSREFPQIFEFDLNDLPQRATGAWCDYVLGVAVVLQQKGYALQGASLFVESEVPIGAGLSSSAAIEVASALALISLAGGTLDPVEMAILCRYTENEFIGARVGIMDQFVSCLGKAGYALLLDCRSLDFELIPIPRQSADGSLQHHGEASARERRVQPASGAVRRRCENPGRSGIPRFALCAIFRSISWLSTRMTFPRPSSSAAAM